MRVPASVRRIALVLTSILLLARMTSAAEPALSADFDGDGRRDHVTVDYADASVLRVWLSTLNATAVIRSSTPVIRVIARDLDGDRRSEIITGSHTGLQVWTKRHHGFKSFKPHRTTPGDLSRPGHRAVHDAPGDPASAVQPPGTVQLGIELAPRPRAPAVNSTAASAASSAPATPAPPHPPLAPRPPPVHA